MNMKKTKKFKENRPENYHVHDTPLHLESDGLPQQGLASMWQFCLGGVEELGDSVVLTDDLVPSLVSASLSSELKSKIANLVQGRYGVMQPTYKKTEE